MAREGQERVRGRQSRPEEQAESQSRSKQAENSSSVFFRFRRSTSMLLLLRTLIAAAAAAADGWDVDPRWERLLRLPSASSREAAATGALFVRPAFWEASRSSPPCASSPSRLPGSVSPWVSGDAHVHMCGRKSSGDPDEAMQQCGLCGRKIPTQLLSKHHLVPKLKGGKSTEDNLVSMHRSCHDKVHAVFTEVQLARDYHSVELLLGDPEISKFVSWIQKRPIDFSDSTMSLRRRRQRKQRR